MLSLATLAACGTGAAATPAADRSANGVSADGARATDNAPAAPVVTTLAADQAPIALAVDGSSVYWTNGGSKPSVRRCAVSGCGGIPITVAEPDHSDPRSQYWQAPYAITADGMNVYWTSIDSSGYGVVWSGPGDGRAGAPTILSPATTPATGDKTKPLDVAVFGSYLYFTSDRSLMFCPKTGCGTDPAQPATPTLWTLAYPMASRFVVSAGGVFFPSGSTVVRVALDGSSPPAPLESDLTIDVPAPASAVEQVAANARDVYWTTTMRKGGTAETLLMKCAVSGCVRATTIARMPWLRVTSLAVDSANVYFVGAPFGGSESSIMKCSLDGCSTQPTILVSREESSAQLALDETSVYWATSTQVRRLTPK